jgi:hypothetical protein
MRCVHSLVVYYLVLYGVVCMVVPNRTVVLYSNILYVRTILVCGVTCFVCALRRCGWNAFMSPSVASSTTKKITLTPSTSTSLGRDNPVARIDNITQT